MIPPMMPPQKLPRPPFVKRGFHMVCSACDLEQRYCRCSERSADAPSADAKDEANLSQRIVEARMRAGGR